MTTLRNALTKEFLILKSGHSLFQSGAHAGNIHAREIIFPLWSWESFGFPGIKSLLVEDPLDGVGVEDKVLDL